MLFNMFRRLILGAYCVVIGGIPAHNEGILGGSRNFTQCHFYFHSIFSQASLFGAHRHIAAPTGFATNHASTCEVKSPNIRPSHDITAIIVYNKAYTILRHNSCIQDLEQMSTHRALVGAVLSSMTPSRYARFFAKSDSYC